MSARLILPTGASTEDWHAARAAGLGGSEIAAVLGLSPFESRFSLWHRKAGLIGPQDANDEMYWGTRLEPVMAEEFARRHPEYRVRRTGTWAHRARPWQIANPDRLLHPIGVIDWVELPSTGMRIPERAIWEGKAPHNADGWGEPGTDEIPVYYRAQVLWYMDVLGVDTTWISALIGGSDYREYLIKRPFASDHLPERQQFLAAMDAEVQLLRTAGREFLDSVRDGVRPDLDAHSATYRTVRALHPDIDGSDAEIDSVVASLYRTAVANAETASETLLLAKTAVLDAMGRARRAVLADGTAIARRQPGPHGSIALHAIRPKALTGQKVSA